MALNAATYPVARRISISAAEEGPPLAPPPLALLPLALPPRPPPRQRKKGKWPKKGPPPRLARR